MLIEKLNSFDANERLKALKGLSNSGQVPSIVTKNVNMHFHSFFSYNAEGWSPSRIAWEAFSRGLYAAGIVDFDVLDGQFEFLDAGMCLGLRVSVGLETRAFLTEYANKEIDSPGEPGVSYILGGGFAQKIEAGTPQGEQLARFRQTSYERNIALISRINPNVSDIAIDYQKDVLPLTPSGNATERHIISAYVNKANTVFGAKVDKFWANILGKPSDEICKLLDNRASLEEQVRTKFAKRGGFGYVQPNETTFPKVEDFFKWVKSCGAIPMDSWLDGTSEGEKDGKALLECSRSKGAAALNLIPDRNWNISNTDVKEMKLQKLHEIVKIADEMDFPIHIGTEI